MTDYLNSCLQCFQIIQQNLITQQYFTKDNQNENKKLLLLGGGGCFSSDKQTKQENKSQKVVPAVNKPEQTQNPQDDDIIVQQQPKQKCETIEEGIVQYKQLIEQNKSKDDQDTLLQTYIPLNGTINRLYQKEDIEKFDLQKEVKTKFIDNYLENPNKFLLILGNSGSGKSLFLKKLFYELMKDYDEKVDLSNKKKIFPIYLMLNQFKVDDKLIDQINTQINGEQAENMLNNGYNLLIFLDGLDEYCNRDKFFYDSLKLQGFFENNFRFIITCRANFFTVEQLQVKFQKKDGTQREQKSYTQIMFICPFSHDQRSQFIEKYLHFYQESAKQITNSLQNMNQNQSQVQKSQENNNTENSSIWKIVEDEINNSPELMDLVQEPFSLFLILQIFPQILERKKLNLNNDEQIENSKREKIQKSWVISKFCETWCEKEKKRNEGKVDYKKINDDFIKIHNTFSQIIAYFMYSSNSINSIQFKQIKEQIKSYDKLVQLFKDNMNKKKDDKNKNKDYNIQQDVFLSLAPLRLIQSDNGFTFQFLHKAIYEYFTASYFIEEIKKLKNNNDQLYQNICQSKLNESLLSKKEIEFLDFSAQILKSDTNKQDISKLLVNIIKQSKNKKEIEMASSNAITILNFIEYNFNYEDFSDVQISFANLSKSCFFQCNFKKANLQEVQFNDAFLVGSNFDESNFKDVKFGVMPDLIGHISPIRCLYPTSDGKKLFSAAADYNIKIWDLQTYGHIQTIYLDCYAKSLIITKNQEYFITSSKEDVIIWNMNNYSIKKKFENKYQVYKLCQSIDENYFFGGSDGAIQVYDIKTLENIKSIKTQQNNIQSLICSPDGKYLISGSSDGSIIFWSIQDDFKESKKLTEQHKGQVYSLCFSYDNRWLFSCSKEIAVWSVEQQYNFVRKLEGHLEDITQVLCSIDSKYLYSSSQDNNIFVWNIETFTKIKELTGHKQSVNCICNSVDGKYLISGDAYNIIKIWNNDFQSNEIKKRQIDITNFASSIICTKDGKYFYIGSGDNKINKWSSESFRELITIVTDHKDGIIEICLSIDEKLLFIAGFFKMNVYSIETCSQFKEITYDYYNRLTGSSIHCSPDGKYFALSCRGEMIIWNLTDGYKSRKKDMLYSDHNSIRFTNDGKFIITARNFTTLQIWNVETFETAKSIEDFNQIISIYMMSNGKTFIGGCDNNTLQIYNIDELTQIKNLEGHNGPIQGLICTKDQKYLITSSWDKSIKIWDLITYENINTIYGHSDRVQTLELVYRKNDILLLSGAEDNSIIIWELKINEKEQKKVDLIFKFRLVNKYFLQLTKIHNQNIKDINDANLKILEQKSK